MRGPSADDSDDDRSRASSDNSGMSLPPAALLHASSASLRRFPEAQHPPVASASLSGGAWVAAASAAAHAHDHHDHHSHAHDSDADSPLLPQRRRPQLPPMHSSTHIAQSAAHATPYVPFLQLPAVRPILSASLFVLSLPQIPRAGVAMENLWGAGECAAVGGMVMAVAVTGATIGLALALQPLHAAAAGALSKRPLQTPFTRACGRALSALATVSRLCLPLLPLALVPTVLWAMWQTLGPARSCWHDAAMRDLAVSDAIAVMLSLALVAAYTLLRRPGAAPLLSSAVPTIGSAPLRGPVHPHESNGGLVSVLLRLRGVLRRHARLLLCILGALFIGAFTYDLRSYNSGLSRTYHWSVIDRPGPCQVSCTREPYRPNPRRRVCLNGHMERVPMHHCLQSLPVHEQIAETHPILDACPELVCKHPDGRRARYHWSIEQERVDASSGAPSSLLPPASPRFFPTHTHRCSLHDERPIERLVLLQSWQCYDELKSVWVHEWNCHPQMPPHAPTYPILHHHAVFLETRHCLHRCQPILRALHAATSLWAAFIAWSILVWTARWAAGVPLRSDEFATRASASSVGSAATISSPLLSSHYSQSRAPSSSLQCASLVGLVPAERSAAASLFYADARALLSRRVAHRSLLPRTAIYAHAVLVYGLPVLGPTVELLLRWATLALLAVAGATAAHFAVWLVDSPCNDFTSLALTYAAAIWTACGSVLLTTLFHLQRPPVIANLQQE